MTKNIQASLASQYTKDLYMKVSNSLVIYANIPALANQILQDTSPNTFPNPDFHVMYVTFQQQQMKIYLDMLKMCTKEAKE